MADRELTIGVVHPGQMGAALGRCLVHRGHRVIWASESRGARTRERAVEAGLDDVGSLSELAGASDVVISVVPPHAAGRIAAEVGARARVFVDANAVSPAESSGLRSMVEGAGGVYVDGSIVGPPPTSSTPTRLFLSGPAAEPLVDVLGGGPVTAIALQGPSAASALKMCYASWTKGTQALLLATLAAARHHGVESDLVEEWGRSHPALETMAGTSATSAAGKGWRWIYEMQAIARTFRDAGLPGEFHDAAAAVFGQLARADVLDPGESPLDAVLRVLVGESRDGPGSARTTS